VSALAVPLRAPAFVGGGSPALRTWRATTATRVFAIALASGSALNTAAFTRSLPVLVSLVLLALAATALSTGRTARLSWVPAAEALLAATLLASLLPSGSLLVYLAVPAVVAGIAHGWVPAVNASLAGALAYAAGSLTTRDLRIVPDDVGAAALWLAVGLGAGVLAGWQTRSLRVLEASQAPYAAAHRLVGRLSELTRAGDVALDTVAAARELGTRVAETAEASRWGVYVGRPANDVDVLAAHEPLPAFPDLARQHLGHRPSWHGRTAMLPLRVGDHVFGVAVVDRDAAWTKEHFAEAQATTDEVALQLETALLFDEVRSLATSEERHRLARDMHDGVAQQMAALGYLVDEIEATSIEPDTLRNAASLREEITSMLGELRLSIFDLRQEVDHQHLSGALGEYAREISAGSDLRVHLVLDEHGEPLHGRVESELLRIAQEAIGNVRKHAGAENLWITFVTDGNALRLEVADDGRGGAVPRQSHYGLHTMRERAERLGAQILVHERPDGGTVVTVTSDAVIRGTEPTTQPRAEVTA